VLGVEVDERMAAIARGQGTEVEVSPFEDWDPRGRRFDLIVAGQAWHWVDPVAGPAKAAALLRPCGLLAPFWNVGTPPPELVAAFDKVYDAEPQLDGYSVASAHGGPTRYAEEAGAIRDSGLFADPWTESFPWRRTYTSEQWLDQLPTHSDHRALPPTRLAEVLAEVKRVVDDHGGWFEMTYETILIRARVMPT
jgi:hypothetical protein